MPETVESGNIVNEIEQVISRARQFMVIASPVINLTENMFIKLAGASALGVKINFLTGTVPDPAVTRLLSVLKNLTLTYVENMNARCYLNESLLLVTSMSLDDMSVISSTDIAVLFTVNKDKEIYDSVIRSIEEVKLKGIKIMFEPGSDEQIISTDKTYRGFCVLCRMPVTFNPVKPYCGACRKVYESGESTCGNFCHSCGADYAAALENNLCNKCRQM